MSRGSGRTTRQIFNAPKDAIYIWPSSRIDYVKKLAKSLDREDLTFVDPSWLESNKWRGLELSGIVRDHFYTLTNAQYECLQQARLRVRV